MCKLCPCCAVLEGAWLPAAAAQTRPIQRLAQQVKRHADASQEEVRVQVCGVERSRDSAIYRVGLHGEMSCACAGVLVSVCLCGCCRYW
jgi:hypothetical protein